MKIRLARFSNLFRREFQLTCLLLGSIFFVVPMVALLLADGFQWLFALLIAAFNLTWFLTLLLGYPGSAQLYEGVISFAEYFEVSKGERKRIQFVITDVRQVEYIQNGLEEQLNIGRIRFRGNAELQPSYQLPEQQMMVFELYGITGFDSFREQFERLMHLDAKALESAQP